jgi:hypothetical protein
LTNLDFHLEIPNNSYPKTSNVAIVTCSRGGHF